MLSFPILIGAVTAAAIATGCAARSPAAMPPGITFLTRADWGAQPPVLPMRPHTPVRLTIHHTGVVQNPQRSLADKLRALQQFSQRDDSLADGRRKPAWADVPYHYYVAVDGSVGEARDSRYAGDSNTPYDPAGHLLVVVEGNFERDTLSAAQRRTIERLVPVLARRFGIPGDSLASHRDYASTSCPGANLYAELPRLRSLIARSTR
ncbi:MAG TPA: peptidoglycan recognition family protein [Gemmatimonadaceae bacterium]